MQNVDCPLLASHKRLGVEKVESVADKFKFFIDGVNTRKYDVVLDSVARTAERARIVDFTVPYTVQDFRLWVHERNTEISDAASLAGKRVGVSAGTTNEVWARGDLSSSEIKAYDGGGCVFNDLVNGRIDAGVDSCAFHIRCIARPTAGCRFPSRQTCAAPAP